MRAVVSSKRANPRISHGLICSSLFAAHRTWRPVPDRSHCAAGPTAHHQRLLRTMQTGPTHRSRRIVAGRCQAGSNVHEQRWFRTCVESRPGPL